MRRFLIGMSVLIALRAEAKDTQEFYRTLTRGILSAAGSARGDLKGGFWQTTIAGSTALWHIDDNTIATLKFDYENGGLQSASIKFMPPAHVAMTDSGECVSVAIASLTYVEGGNIDKADWAFDTSGGCKRNTTFPRLIRHLEFPATPDRLFTGAFIRGAESTSQCDGSGNGCRSPAAMVSRIHFFPSTSSSGAPLPAIEVRLKDHTDIALPGGDYIDAKSGSGFKFSDFDYFLDEKEGDGRLDDFTLNLYRAQLTPDAGDRLILASGKLTFSNVDLIRVAGRIELSHAAVEAELDRGSTLVLSAAIARRTELTFDTGTSIQMNDFSIAINDGQSPTLSFGSASIDALLSGGRLAFGEDEFVQLGKASSTLSATHGIWGPGGDPRVQGDISVLNAAVVGGVLRPSPDVILRLASGHIKAPHLAFNSAPPSISGTLTEANFEFETGSVVATHANVSFTTTAGAAAQLADPAAPLIIANGPLAGRLSAHLPIGSGSLAFQNGSNLSLVGGVVDTELQLGTDPIATRVTGTLKTANGIVQIAGNSIPISFGEIAGLDLSIGSTGVLGTARTFEAILGSGRVRLGESLDVNLLPGAAIVSDPTLSVGFKTAAVPMIGSFRVAGKFSTLRIAGATALQLSNGSLEIQTLALMPNGELRLSSAAFSGDVPIDGGVINGKDVGFIAPMRVTGFGATSASTGLSFEGTISGTIPATWSIPIVTPFIKGYTDGGGLHKDARVFPISLSLEPSAPIDFGPMHIAYVNGKLSGSVNATASFTVSLPQGGGEHVDYDNPATGTRGNAGDDPKMQELATDTYTGCRRHIYLPSQNLSGSAPLAIAFNDQGLDISLTGPTTLPVPQYDQVGCNIPVLGAIIGAISSVAVVGNPIPGAILGAIAGEKLEDYLHDLINNFVAAQIAAYRNTWHFQT